MRIRDASRGWKIHQAAGYRKPNLMIDASHVVAYLYEQRKRVADSGQCVGGCERTEQIEHYATGKRVCPHTMEECPAANG